jgi:hypothetical protein
VNIFIKKINISPLERLDNYVFLFLKPLSINLKFDIQSFLSQSNNNAFFIKFCANLSVLGSNIKDSTMWCEWTPFIQKLQNVNRYKSLA